MPDAADVNPGLNATAASLLGFLTFGPSSGYELAERIESSIGNFWNVTRSQIYRELRSLERLGLVDAGGRSARDRTPYSITPAGERAFTAWIARDPAEGLRRFPLLLTVFFGNHVPREELARMLRIQRAQHEAKLAEFRRRLPAVEPEHPYPALTLRFGIMNEEMILKWIDSIELP